MSDSVVAAVRKVYEVVEEVRREGGVDIDSPTRVAAVVAVVDNPFAGSFHQDLEPLIDAYSDLLGSMLSERCAALLRAPGEAFGKGALVGSEGEIEHGSAIIHTLRFGDHARVALGATSLVPSVEKRGAPGASMDIPLKHVHDLKIRSHHQSFEVRVPDAPGPREIAVALAFASSGRPLARLAAFGSEDSAVAPGAPA